MTQSFRRRRTKTQGFTLIEVCLALIVFLLMTLVFAAIFPLALGAAKTSDNYAQASQIAQHKIDQLRAVGFSGLNYNGLSGASIIDPIPVGSQPTGLPATYHFENIDNLISNGGSTGYFPPGSTGTITVRDYAAYAASQNAGGYLPPAGTVDYVTVTITWTGAGTHSGTYSASAMIIQMKHT